MKTIDVARDFSTLPYGRYRTDGEHSGEAFREDFLIPAFTHSDKIEIFLDGTEGYGSSFLEEAFGGLVRRGISQSDLRQRLILHSDEDPTCIDDIWYYVEQIEDTMK